jgi:response regulator of citrate/malate metabolism
VAERGKPIPVAVRLQIKEQRTNTTVRALADALRLSKTTVQKYAGKIGTKG